MRYRRPRQPSDRGPQLKARPRFVALGLCALLSVSGGVAGESLSDLHDVNIGMSVQDLPASGYRDLSYVGTANQPVESWHDWMSCPANAEGLRGLRVEYDQPGQDATLVAGHPVDLSLFFDGSARLVRIEIEPRIRQVLTCGKKPTDLASKRKNTTAMRAGPVNRRNRAPTRKTIGPTYINDTCSKTLDNRAIEVTNRFFHKSGGSPRDFVSESLVVVSLRSPEAK